MKIGLRRFGPYNVMLFAGMLVFGIASAAEDAGAILHVIPAVRSNRISSIALPAEGYRLRIDAAGNANIKAADDAGRFYAEKTLAQLPHPLPECEIEDWPSFSWRGVHLDESRHFFGKETVKRLLDRLADFKYNVFHWHLMDNQGNRIPLHSYQRMNSLGAMRSALDHCDLTRGSEEFRYGPFGYTREEIMEILNYAKARHIRVMPEIEMPGHAAAVIRAYPELFCGDASDLALARTRPYSAREDVMSETVVCLGNDSTIEFYEGVIDEVCNLFPDADVIHIGGDECPTKNWKKCSKCNRRMAELGLGDDWGGLQRWFMKRMVDRLAAKGRKAAVWDEPNNACFVKDTIAFAWRGIKSCSAATTGGRQAVMCPDDYCYLNNPQGLGSVDTHQYPWWCDWNKTQQITLEWMYSWDPLKGIAPEMRKSVLGGQVANWTEFTPDEDDLQWKLWPRACAAAEILWSGAGTHDFADFASRLQPICRRMIEEGVNVAMPGRISKRGHEIKIDGRATCPEEGLVFGNGDLSCSVWQDGDEIVFRFGKGDVWDRRLNFSTTPDKPVTHDEFVRWMLECGLTCNNYKGGKAVATKGTTEQARIDAVCQGTSEVTRDFPYPCPKPTGELRVRIAPDMMLQARISQRIQAERGIYELRAASKSGTCIFIEAAIAPDANVFSLRWRLDGSSQENYPTRGRSPVAIRLERAADGPFLAQYAKEASRRHPSPDYLPPDAPDAPLPPPKTLRDGKGRLAIQQDFWKEATFPDGFKCRLTFCHDATPGSTFALGGVGGKGDMLDANVCFRPKAELTEGEVQVVVTTSTDKTLEANVPKRHSEIVANASARARRLSSRSDISIPSDPFLENLWYANRHVRQSVLKPGTVPPGLFLPSTVGDYSHWHGDWHANYNYQQIYYGTLAANLVEEHVSCLDCTEQYFGIGRLRASECYGMRGVFVPLEGFPVKAVRDWSAALPLGRMVYMTGWMTVPLWEHYLYTLDRKYLEKRGYPAIRECALFFLDFLKKAPSKDLPPELKDGLYHAFPSIQEEETIRSLADVTDRPQVIAFARYALWCAIEAAKVLGTDDDLRKAWKDRLDNLYGTRRELTGYARHRYLSNSPEFGEIVPDAKTMARDVGKQDVRKFTPGWYFGSTIRGRIRSVRAGLFDPERDFDEYRKSLEYWAHENGTVQAMSISLYGRAGSWTETLSCMAPLQEMMLQSWDGAINVFPCWPKGLDASFRSFRAQGAFLVSAVWRAGRVASCEIVSEKGATCVLHGDWRVYDGTTGTEMATSRDEFERLCFPTVPGGRYRLEKK